MKVGKQLIQSSPHPETAAGIRLSSKASWLQIANALVFIMLVSAGAVQAQALDANIASTASPSAGETLQNGGPGQLNDGNLTNSFDAWSKEFDSTRNTAFVQLEWPGDVRIGRVRIWGRQGYEARISGSIVTITDAAGNTVYASAPTIISGHEANLPYVERAFEPPVSGKILRMTGSSDNSHVVNVGEIQVFPANIAPPAGSEVFSFDGNNFKEFELSSEAYNELTIELWAKRGAREEGIILFHSGIGRQYPGVRVDGRLEWAAGGGANYPNGVKANFPLPRDTWVHLAFVKNAPANQMVVYVNGVERVNVQGGTDRQAHNAPTAIGIFRLGHSLPTQANGWSPSWMVKHGFQGDVAQVRIWKVVRTPEQILNGMRALTDQLPSKTGLLLYGPKGGKLTQPAS